MEEQNMKDKSDKEIQEFINKYNHDYWKKGDFNSYIRELPPDFTSNITEEERDAIYKNMKITDYAKRHNLPHTGDKIQDMYIEFLYDRQTKEEKTEIRYLVKNIQDMGTYKEMLPSLITKMKQGTNFLGDETNADKEFADVWHKEVIIRSGQFSEVHNKKAFDDYIKAMDYIGIDPDIIKAVSSMSLQDFQELTKISRPEVIQGQFLPDIREFYSAGSPPNDNSEGLDEYISMLEDEIRSAYRFKTGQSIEDTIANEEAMEQQMEVYRKPMPRYTRVPKQKKYVHIFGKHAKSASSVESLIQDKVARYASMHNGEVNIKVAKDGHVYIPFVGTSRKNNAIGRAIKHLYGNK